MIKIQKSVCFIVILCLVFSAVVFTSCDNSDEYPVTVGNIQIDKEPKNIVALADNVADILSTIGYDVKLVGRSQECDQEQLSVVPQVGTKSQPDVAAIAEYEAEIVFADASLEASYKAQLEDAGIIVITVYPSDTMEELKVLYKTIGTALGGNITGKKKGEEGFSKFTVTLEDISRMIPESEVLNTICYLYLEDGYLKTFIGKSYGDAILEYTGAVNVAANFETGIVDESVLKLSNPSYIFYSGGDVLEYLKTSDDLKGLAALASEKAFEMPRQYFMRHGDTAIDAVTFMAGKIHPKLNFNTATNDQAATSAPVPVDIETVADEYGLTITENMELKPDDENDNVMALQKRLDDLGYLSVEPTGFFGELTTSAIIDFQYVNSLPQTGKATVDVLVAIFSTDAIKNSTPAR